MTVARLLVRLSVITVIPAAVTTGIGLVAPSAVAAPQWRQPARHMAAASHVPAAAGLVPAAAGLRLMARRAARTGAVTGNSFPFNTISPPTGGLASVSCVSASFCMAVGTAAVSGLAEEWNGRTWRVVPSPPDVFGVSVSCASEAFCMAISTQAAEVWNGRRWRALPGVVHQMAVMSGVSCTRRTFCLAVGHDIPDQANVSARWNGRAWRALVTPDTGCTAFCGLSGLSCATSASCLAVGSTLNNASSQGAAAAIIWNGRRWHVRNPRSPGIDAVLSGVSCAAGLRCVAVGGYTTGARPCPCTLIESWDGARWRRFTSAAFAGTLAGVSCRRLVSCIAVGDPLALVRHGGAWKQVPIVTPGEQQTQLAGISCWRPSACMAVGEYVTAAGAVLTLAERWDGKRWQVRRTPTPGDQFSGLASVSCPAAASCIAVGGRLSRSDDQAALAERWNGRAWRVLPAPSPGSQVSVLTAVSCGRPDSCTAVGYFDASGLPQAFAARWNGRSWRVRKIPQEGILTGLACSGAGSCMAVGSFTSAAGHQQPLAVRWNGSGWRVLSVPVPAGSEDAELAGVSCANGASCVAVGAADRVPSGSIYPAAVVWNGRSWRLAQVRSGVRGELIGISCQAGRHRCVAVGEKRNAILNITGTLAESWDGRAWRRLAMPQSPTRQMPQLADVSCRAPSACVAAGEYLTRSGRALALAESWDGHAWRLLRTAAPDRSFDVLYAVSCARAMRCVAVGEQAVQRTLAERWTGSRWRVLLTPNP